MADEIEYEHRDYRGTPGAIKDAEEGKGAKPAESAPPPVTTRDSGVSVSEVHRTEREPEKDEGTRSFGAPLSTPPPSTERQRKGQSTDDSN
jgi:hypothetical protein